MDSVDAKTSSQKEVMQSSVSASLLINFEAVVQLNLIQRDLKDA